MIFVSKGVWIIEIRQLSSREALDGEDDQVSALEGGVDKAITPQAGTQIPGACGATPGAVTSSFAVTVLRDLS